MVGNITDHRWCLARIDGMAARCLNYYYYYYYFFFFDFTFFQVVVSNKLPPYLTLDYIIDLPVIFSSKIIILML